MEELFDLIVDDCDCCIDPSASFEELEDLILKESDVESKEIEDISFGHMEPMSTLDNLKEDIMRDGAFEEGREKKVISPKNDNRQD